jgi:mono/diheme cytochrome c family protein
MSMRCRAYALLILALAGTLFAGVGDGQWLRKVPAKDRARTHPFAADPDAPAAGGKIFAEHCVQCHGADAEGKQEGKHIRPNLHSDRVRQATPGELFWLLTNGSQKNGMPSWSRLPEAQRWQVISFLKTLP